MKDDEKVLNKKLGTGVILLAILGMLVTAILFVFPTQQALGKPLLGKTDIAKVAVVKNDIQDVSIDLKSRSYAPIVVQKGIPVKFNVKATKESINGCNGTIIIPEFNIEKTLVPGDNIIEFTPDNEGTIAYSCWMGMVRSSIQVVSDLNTANISALPVQKNVGIGPACFNQSQ